MDVFDVLSYLTPWDINIPKRRVGCIGDGGYIMADCLRPTQSVISYGIANEVSFDVELAEAGHKIWQFDHTIVGAPVTHPNITFTREGVAGTDQPDELLYTIETHAARLEIPRAGAILKMDVEGAEWEVLDGISPEALGQFDQILMEFHGMSRIVHPKFMKRFIDVMEKLNAQFTLFHVHANNARPLVSVDHFVTPGLIEVSYIRTDLVTREPSKTVYPTPMDSPNVAGRPDLRLWLYPFAPRG